MELGPFFQGNSLLPKELQPFHDKNSLLSDEVIFFPKEFFLLLVQVVFHNILNYSLKTFSLTKNFILLHGAITLFRKAICLGPTLNFIFPREIAS
jgi:hypothetical protein